MPIDLSQTVDMTPVSTGSMIEIPPDISAGHFMGSFSLEAKATKGNDRDPNHYPMLMLRVTVEESYTEGVEGAEGKTTTIFITFFPETHAGAKMTKATTKSLCESYEDLPTLDTSSLENDPPSWDSVAPWVEALESQKRQFWVTLEKDRRTGGMQSRVHFHEVGQPLKVDADLADAKPAKKANGSANGTAKKSKK